MSLDNIQLPASVIQQLFNESLVELKSVQIKSTDEKKSSDHNIQMLGKFQKNILIIVNEPDEKYLSDEKLNFIISILSACKLTMEDAGIVNCHNNQEIHYNAIQKQLNPKVMLVFGSELQALDFPFVVPNFQIHTHNKQIFVTAPEVGILQHDKAMKLLLWNCLKTIFNV
jgi:hypothetical protein